MSKLHYFNITYLCDSDCLFCAANIGLIDHTSYTMSPSCFEQDLLAGDVHAGDHVMISGGEPTLSPYFWDILDICEKYKCSIDITTNGHFFANIDNVTRLSSYSSVIIRIPFFGVGAYHDYLTGAVGNYEKAIKSLANFSKTIKTSHFIVNVKFLLCKATTKSNSEIYQLIYSQYGDLFEYTLSPILVSKKAILHADALLAPYTQLLQECQEFVEHDNLNCDIIPLCLLSSHKISQFLKRKKISFDKLYADAKLKYSDMENYHSSSCTVCKLNSYCDKFLPSYIDYFGEGEIRPFL